MQPTPASEVELFVLQKCWFSGPHHEPSVDCMRLFTSRREAEEVAFHTAHEFANRSIFATNGVNSPVGPTRQHLNASVKTILLPPSTLGVKSSSYAFQTCGKLFWVRSLKATVIPPGAVSFGNVFPYASAQVIVTEGIIGGTGNPNSRRGGEISEGRVFLSMDNSQAHRVAEEVAAKLRMNMAQNHPNATISVVTVPIGKPEHGATQDWPNNGLMVPQQDENMILADTQTNNKREWAMAAVAADAQLNSTNLSAKRHCPLMM